MNQWIFEGRVEHDMDAANNTSGDGQSEPLTREERCRRAVLYFYVYGEGVEKTCVFAVAFKIQRMVGATVLRLCRQSQPDPQGLTCLRTRKRVQNTVDRLLRHRLAVIDDEGRLSLTAQGDRFVSDGIRSRTANLKALRLPVADACAMCEKEELPTRTLDDGIADSTEPLGGELTRDLPHVLKAWY